MNKVAYLVTLLGRNKNDYMPVAALSFAESPETAIRKSVKEFKTHYPDFLVVEYKADVVILSDSVQISNERYLFKNE